MKIKVPVIGGDNNLRNGGGEFLIEDRLVERLFILADFISRDDPEMAFCCHFLEEIGGDAVWSTLFNFSDTLIQRINFFNFTSLVYSEARAKDPEGAKNALQRTVPGENIEDSIVQFTSAMRLYSKYHIWRWA